MGTSGEERRPLRDGGEREAEAAHLAKRVARTMP